MQICKQQNASPKHGVASNGAVHNNVVVNLGIERRNLVMIREKIMTSRPNQAIIFVKKSQIHDLEMFLTKNSPAERRAIPDSVVICI